MRLLNKALSWSLYAAVITMMVFAMAANFLIIAQAFFSPLNVVQGNSMSPVVNQGDAVLLTGAATESLNVGDIVVFPDPENPDSNIIHRIVGMNTEDGMVYAVTKGDANAVEDPYMTPADEVEGKVSLVLPKAGFFLSFLRTPPGFIICVLSPFAVLLLYLFAKWYQESRGTGKTALTRDLLPGSKVASGN
jgi:signal peptidase I